MSGDPPAEDMAHALADLQAEDGSVWVADPATGQFVTDDPRYAGVSCTEAAAVAAHVSGEDGTVRQHHAEGQS